MVCVARDTYPVTAGHTLLIPKRHAPNYFGLGQAEINAIHQLTDWIRIDPKRVDRTITGFGVDVNIGENAVRTYMHDHLYVFPRRDRIRSTDWEVSGMCSPGRATIGRCPRKALC